jgi:hypothetical protein
MPMIYRSDMKPFNLDLAIAGEPIVTRTGIKVTECYLFKTIDGPFKFLGIIEGDHHVFDKNGKYLVKQESEYDLFMETPERWVNVYWLKYHGITGTSLTDIYPSEKSAQEAVTDFDNYQTTIKLKKI